MIVSSRFAGFFVVGALLAGGCSTGDPATPRAAGTADSTRTPDPTGTATDPSGMTDDEIDWVVRSISELCAAHRGVAISAKGA